jgi:hypothetical protein
LEGIDIETTALNEEGDTSTKEVNVLNTLNVMKDRMITGVTNESGMSKFSRLLYFNVLPKLEIHGLAETEKIPGVRFKRYRLTAKGKALLAYMDRKASREKQT